VSGLREQLDAEPKHSREVQQAWEQSQQAHSVLQEDCYSKESEVSALRQDLEMWEETLALAQEELAGKRTHQTAWRARSKTLRRAGPLWSRSWPHETTGSSSRTRPCRSCRNNSVSLRRSWGKRGVGWRSW